MLWRRTVLCTAFTTWRGARSGGRRGEEIVVQIAPPAARVEVVPAPRTGYVWAPGYWGWRNNKHYWVNGHYIRERHGYHWVPDRWDDRDGRWYFHGEDGSAESVVDRNSSIRGVGAR